MVVVSVDGQHHIVKDYAQSTIGPRPTSTTSSLNGRRKKYMYDNGSKIGIGSRYATIQPSDDDKINKDARMEDEIDKKRVSQVNKISALPIGPQQSKRQVQASQKRTKEEMNDDMIGCSDDGDEEIIEVYEKI